EAIEQLTRALSQIGELPSTPALRREQIELQALDAVPASLEGVLPLSSLRRAAMASSSLRRWPGAATPSSFRASAVRVRRTVSSISFSRKIASYFPRPRLRSQTTMSMTAPQTQGCCTSSFRLEGVSRRPETAADNRFRCQLVHYAKISVSDQRAGLCHHDR